ncbi:unnamed protein product, partial [Mycena citricolor]
DGLVYLRNKDHVALCIPRIELDGRSVQEIVISEAHSILAHLGPRKTLDYLKEYVWWKDMVDDVQAFCETCITWRPWEAIGVDFVGPLPESKNRDGVFNSITVVICLLTGMVHLVPSRVNYTARQVAEL